jgi:hypothetical protein
VTGVRTSTTDSDIVSPNSLLQRRRKMCKMCAKSTTKERS